MGAKKGAKQNDWCVYRKPYEGKLYEKNEYLHELPPVGSYVVVWRRHENFKRGYGKNKDILGVYDLDDNCLDALGRPLVYKVVEYKLGTDKEVATNKANSVYLESGGIRGLVTYKKWIDTVRICNGYYYLEIMESSRQIYDSQDVYCMSIDDKPVAEKVASIEMNKEK